MLEQLKKELRRTQEDMSLKLSLYEKTTKAENERVERMRGKEIEDLKEALAKASKEIEDNEKSHLYIVESLKQTKTRLEENLKDWTLKAEEIIKKKDEEINVNFKIKLNYFKFKINLNQELQEVKGDLMLKLEKTEDKLREAMKIKNERELEMKIREKEEEEMRKQKEVQEEAAKKIQAHYRGFKVIS